MKTPVKLSVKKFEGYLEWVLMAMHEWVKDYGNQYQIQAVTIQELERDWVGIITFKAPENK